MWILRTLLFADRDLFGNFSADRCDLAFQVTQPGLLRVLIDDCAYAVVRELDLAALEPVFCRLFRNQMPLGDLDLFLFGVAGELK